MPLRVLRTLVGSAVGTGSGTGNGTGTGSGAAPPALCWRDGEVQALCADGVLRLLEFELEGQVRDATAFRARFGDTVLPLADGRK
jgi:hypothetical protein